LTRASTQYTRYSLLRPFANIQNVLQYLDVELEILPLTETSVLVAFDELSKDVTPQTGKDLVDVRLQGNK